MKTKYCSKCLKPKKFKMVFKNFNGWCNECYEDLKFNFEMRQLERKIMRDEIELTKFRMRTGI